MMSRSARLVRVFQLVTAMLSLALAATAQIPDGARLPYSGGVLVARAIRSGLLQRPGQSGPSNLTINPDINCSPAPCVLPNVQASGIGTAPANETPIAVNPRNAKQLLTGANDYNCPNIQGFYTSGDGGSTWTRTCMGNLSPGAGDGDPGVGYDLNGNAYITGIDGGTADGSDIIFEKSSNNGATWSAPAVAVKPLFGTSGLTDKDWLQIDVSPTSPRKNNLYISVTQFDSSSNTAISVSHSTNGGGTWSTVQVDTLQAYPAIDQFSDIAIAKNGTVYVSWMRCTANGKTGDCGGTTATLVISKSTNGGNTWSTPKTIATVNLAPDTCGAFYGCLPNTNERVSNIPVIAVDNSTGPNAGHLYVVYYNWTGSQMKVYVTHSTDGGTTWSAGVAVAPATATHDQFFPWLNVSARGTVGVTWLDRRNDAANI